MRTINKITQQKNITYDLDSTVRKLLRKFQSVEIIEQIESLFPHIKNPNNFYDEIVVLLEINELCLPALMLIHRLMETFNFEYEFFYIRLESLITTETVSSEGFLLFILRCIHQVKVEARKIKSIVLKLSRLSVLVSSCCCARVVYSILVIMRINPGVYQYTKEMKELYMLAASTDLIRSIVKQIFIEAGNPKVRPKMVFLEHFAFPTMT